MTFFFIFILIFGVLGSVSGQCTWQSPFASSTWHDSTRGDITFTTTTLTGWLITARSQTFNQWECVDNSSSSYIIMRATNQLTFSTLTFHVFACLQLTQITDVSYRYYLVNQQESNGGNERLRFSLTNNLTAISHVCDSTVSVPTQEFHVLVKSGVESSAQITCPTSFLFTADYVYNDTSTFACGDSVDSWDVCTVTSEMTFNYNTCSQMIAFTSGGRLWCVASVGQCLVVYNQDTSITATTRQFACLCSDGTSVAVAPNNCTATQTPGMIPTGPDGVSAIGHIVTVGTKFVDCAPTTEASSESSGGGVPIGVIVGVVVAVLLLIAIIIIVLLFIRHKKRNGNNKVNESAKPILLDNETARVETVSETARVNRSSKREKTSLSREGSKLDKSMLEGRASVTSIGLEPKSDRGLSREKTSASRKSVTGLEKEKSNVTLISVKPGGAGEKHDKESPVKALLARLPCWPKEKEPPKEEPSKEAEPESPKTPPSAVKAVSGKKGAKKGAAATKGKKGKGGKKGTKADKGGKDKDSKKGKEENADKLTDFVITDVEDEKPKSKDGGPKFTSTPIPKDSKEKSFVTDWKLSAFDGTPIPADSKEKSFAAGGKMPTFVSMPSALQKPVDRKTGWPLLVCCAGASTPVQEEPPSSQSKEEPVQEPKKASSKGKAVAKGKGKPVKKTGGEKGKKKTKKQEASSKSSAEKADTDKDDEPDKLDRANTMPERVQGKTVLSLTDAEKVKVDVYLPNEQTQLQLKDTVTVIKDKNGETQMEKAKTTLGLTRPTSSVSKASKPSGSKTSDKGDKSPKKGKEKGKTDKGGKEKKGGAKKKKK